MLCMQMEQTGAKSRGLDSSKITYLKDRMQHVNVQLVINSSEGKL